MSNNTVFGPYDDGGDDDPVCAECLSDLDWIKCTICFGEGGFNSDELMSQDPLWYDGVDWEACSNCDGQGGWWHCFNCQEKVSK